MAIPSQDMQDAAPYLTSKNYSLVVEFEINAEAVQVWENQNGNSVVLQDDQQVLIVYDLSRSDLESVP